MASAPLTTGMAGFHTHRLDARRYTLHRVFSADVMERAWKRHVREGLRQQEVLDLHDYNDFHWNRAKLFQNLSAEISAGRYAPARSVPIRIEKKNGVTRTLVIPAPEDAIVLQCIVEYILPVARSKQPSENAFFSRSHGFVAPSMRFQKDYIWFRRWAEFSKIRFEISSSHNYICTTDIANYFDNIDYGHLRNMMSSLGEIDEVTMDVLFLVLDAISWRPDYLPSPGRSLPQVNFDAPRLLSHIYLFEVDEFLRKKSSNSFVRWVDDITVAADSVTGAKEILRDLDRLLMTRGLRLNSGKTQVLSAREAHRFFYTTENAFLDKVGAALASAPGGRSLKRLQINLRKRFDKFRISVKYGHWDKIVKRYLTIFSRTRDPHALNFCLEVLPSEPVLRESIWRYFISLGPSPKALRAIRSYLLGPHALDDASVFQAARVLTEWEIAPRSRLHRSIKKLGLDLGEAEHVSKSPFYFIAALWLLGKYGLRGDVYSLVSRHSGVWRASEFLSRQVASILPKMRGNGDSKKLRRMIESHQFTSANSVLASLDAMQDGTRAVPNYIRMYILNGKHRNTYSLQRFLVCLHVIACKKLEPKIREQLRKDVLRYVSDPIYVSVLTAVKI